MNTFKPKLYITRHSWFKLLFVVELHLNM